MARVEETAQASQPRCTEPVPLLDWIPFVSPSFRPPHHLGWVVERLDSIDTPRDGRRFFWFSVPPRHWKTETLKHAAVRQIALHPEQSVAYCAHTQAYANKINRSLRRMARGLGIQLAEDSRRQDEWETTAGGGMFARGVGGEITGRGFDLIVVDDPVKSREKAESQADRDRIWDWLNDDVITRLTPTGVLLLVHTRWHPDDPIGRARGEERWEGQNLKALSGPTEDDPLLPSVWNLELLDEIRRTNPFTFSALYQGEPRARGGKVFGEPHWHDPGKVPHASYSLAHGVDLAYTAKTHADWSVCATMLRWRDTFYVVDVRRAQVAQPDFLQTLRTAHKLRPGAMRWYASGTEKVAADFAQDSGVPLEVVPATSDKFIRAQPLAAAWNDGRVLLPAGVDDEPPPDWVEAVVGEFSNFTGVNDKHDDIVDAMAAAFDVLSESPDIDTDFLESLEPASRWGAEPARGF